MKEEASILTSINEPVVVLLLRLVAMTFLLEDDFGDTLGATLSVIMEVDLAKRPDCGVKKLLFSH